MASSGHPHIRPHLLVIRHGLTEWNAAGRWQGWADIPLSETGRAQAADAARRLQTDEVQFERIVFSDLVRAAETARLMADVLGIGERCAHAGLRERDVGEWSGLLTDDIELRWPGQLGAWRGGDLDRIPGGESETGLRSRICAALDAIAADPRPALVVTHGGVIRTLDRCYGAEPRPVANLGGRWFGRNEHRGVAADATVDLLDGLRPTTVVL